MRRGRASIVLAAAALGVATMFAAAPANAATPEPAAAAQTCWFNTDDQVMQCFDSQADFRAAVQAQTGGQLLLAGEQPAAAATPDALAPDAVASPAATYVLATLYDNANYDTSAGTVNITTSNSTLCTSYNYTGNSMPSGWNDRVSSFHSYGTCKTRLATNINQGGPYTATVASLATLGSMNDQASSYFITG